MGGVTHQWDLFRDQVNVLLRFLHVNCCIILNMQELDITLRHQHFRKTKWSKATNPLGTTHTHTHTHTRKYIYIYIYILGI